MWGGSSWHPRGSQRGEAGARGRMVCVKKGPEAGLCLVCWVRTRSPWLAVACKILRKGRKDASRHVVPCLVGPREDLGFDS